MLIKRSRGRPTQNDDFVGRSGIIEGTRTFLRQRRPVEITRNTLAEHIGITPALISYYFRDRSELVTQSTTPIVTRYIGELSKILQTELSNLDRTSEIVAIFSRCIEADGGIFDCYDYYRAEISALTKDDLLDIFFDLAEQGFGSCMINDGEDFDPASMTQVVWAVCQSLSQRRDVGSEARHPVELEMDLAKQKTARIVRVLSGAFDLSHHPLRSVVTDARPTEH